MGNDGGQRGKSRCNQRPAFGPIIHISHSDFTDQRVLPTAPQIYFDVQREAFDYLYRHEPMALLEMVLHCHWAAGR